MKSQWSFIFKTWAWQANFTYEEYKQYKDEFLQRRFFWISIRRNRISNILVVILSAKENDIS